MNFFVSSQNLVLLGRTSFFPVSCKVWCIEATVTEWMMSCSVFSFFVYICVPESTSFLCVIVHTPVDKRVRWCSLLSKFQLCTASVTLTVWSSNPRKARSTCVAALCLACANYFGRGSVFGRQQHSKHFLRSKMSPKKAMVRYSKLKFSSKGYFSGDIFLL